MESIEPHSAQILFFREQGANVPLTHKISVIASKASYSWKTEGSKLNVNTKFHL